MRELEFLLQQGKVLNASEKSHLIEEFQKLTDVVNLGIRSGENDAEMNVNTMVFETSSLILKRTAHY